MNSPRNLITSSRPRQSLLQSLGESIYTGLGGARRSHNQYVPFSQLVAEQNAGRGLFNRSGFTKQQILNSPEFTDKKALSEMSDEDFIHTVFTPSGQVARYESSVAPHLFTGDNEITPLTSIEYADAFNSRLDLLNDIIAKNNKSGVNYRVKAIDSNGKLTFHTPKQIKRWQDEPGIVKTVEDLEKLKNDPVELQKRLHANAETLEDFDRIINSLKEDRIIAPEGESSWNTRINPGEWRGTVENFPSREYYESIPGLKMAGTTSGVFSDGIVRKGSGAYKSVNEYLKTLDLGRVKAGFNSQSKDSRGLWETYVKKGIAAGHWGDPFTVHGVMKKNGGWLDKYEDGGELNYNDSSVSAPEGFEGDGYSNVGRNYSPAWGGQFKEGGKVPATKQDSLNLYNNAKKVLNYYSNKNYRKDSEDYSSWEGYNEWVHNHNKTFLTVFNSSNKVNVSPSRVPLASGKSASMVLPESTYYKKLDDNRYMQREHNSAILDTRAPMQLFDKRVVPTMEVQYDNINIKDTMYGDMVGIYGYDPVLVKPASMLTPQERALRIERYGEASGLVNTKPKPKPTTKTKSEVKLKPQSKPIPTPQSTIDFMEGNYAQEPITEIPQPQPQASAYGEVIDPRTGYTHMTRQGSPMYPMVGQNVPEMEEGGPVKRFMQPTETFKNFGYNPKEKGLSTEYSTSIGGPGEVYLVPGYRQGRLLNDPEATFNMYGEHLGGPFKTVQAAEDFAKFRHDYVDKNKNIPAPFKTRDYAMGGSLPGATGSMYARYSGGGSMPGDVDFRYPRTGQIPDNGKYAKKTMASAENGAEMKYYQEGLDFKPKTISRDGSQLVKLDQLTNFTNYNTKQPGGWLDKYES
jgi:hypothetical protein